MRRLPEPPLGLIVFVVGISILGAEIAAARLLAPYFGASTIVWANTIGIVLVALSVGYWYGGRLADRNPSREGLYRIVLQAGLLLAAVPFAASPFLGFAWRSPTSSRRAPSRGASTRSRPSAASSGRSCRRCCSSR